jgi:hypothetical protein
MWLCLRDSALLRVELVGGRLWELTPSGLEASHYLLNEFGAGGRQGSVRR